LAEWLCQQSSPGQALLGGSAILLAAYGLGRIALIQSGRIDLRRGILTFVVGTNLLILFLFLLGVCGVLRQIVVAPCLISAACIGSWFVIRDVPRKRESWRPLLPIVGAGVIALVLLGSSLVLPINWDEMVYQLALPSRWLRDGQLLVYVDNPYSGFPSAGSLLFTGALAVGGLAAAKVVVLGCWCVGILALWVLLGERTEGWTKGAVCFGFAASEAVVMVGSSAYVEAFLLLQIGGMLLLMSREGGSEPSGRNLLILGMFGGISAATKLTGIIPVVGIAGFLLMSQRRLRQAALFGVTVATFALPFYLRPWLLTGNPFHPYFAEWFSTTAGVVEMGAYHHALGAAKFGISGIAGFLLSPVFLTIPRLSRAFDGGFGLQYLALSLWAVLSWRQQGWHLSAPTKNTLLVAGICYLGWFLTAQQARFMVSGAFALTVAMGMMLQHTTPKWRRWLAAALVSAAIACLPLRILRHAAVCWRTILRGGEQVNLLYTATGDAYVPLLDFLRTETAAESRVLLLFENRGLYVPRDYIIGTPFFQAELFTPPEGISATGIVSELRRLGVSHVLTNFSIDDPDRLPEYLARSNGLARSLGELAENGVLKKVFSRGNGAIYEFR